MTITQSIILVLILEIIFFFAPSYGGGSIACSYVVDISSEIYDFYSHQVREVSQICHNDISNFHRENPQLSGEEFKNQLQHLGEVCMAKIYNEYHLLLTSLELQLGLPYGFTDDSIEKFPVSCIKPQHLNFFGHLSDFMEEIRAKIRKIKKLH